MSQCQDIATTAVLRKLSGFRGEAYMYIHIYNILYIYRYIDSKGGFLQDSSRVELKKILQDSEPGIAPLS